MTIKENESLKERTLSSLFSSYFVTFANKGVYIISHIILARILFPEDFGLFALAFIVLNIAKVIIQLGLGRYIIREERVHYGALFVLELIAGLFVFILLQIITPHLAKYNSALPAINRIFSFAVIPYCLSIVPRTYAQKELRLKEMLIPNLLHFLTFALGAILLALNGLRVWSLVYAHIMSEVVLAYFSWRALGSSIAMDFHFGIKEIFKPVFGARYFFALTVFGMFVANIDRIILGKLVALKDIGYYAIALTLSMYFADIIEPALNNVFFPLFSKIKKDISKTKEFYASATVILYWLEVPLYLFLVFNADIIIRIIFGAKWLPAINIFRLLAIIPILYPCSTFGVHIIQAHSMENIQLHIGILRFCLFIVIGWFSVIKMGVIGIVWTQFFISPLTVIFLYFVNKITRNIIPLLIKLFPIYAFCVIGLGLIYIIFKPGILAFSVSLIYILIFYIVYYISQIHQIIVSNFSDVPLFKKLRIV